ncbi:MAG: hypothetical protein WD749_11950 [Phycisphaerales bacterium]
MNARPAIVFVLAAGLAASCVAQAPDGSSAVSRNPGGPDASVAGSERGLDPRIAALGAPAVAFVQHPSISPDGRSIVFAYGGDLWTVLASGGAAERLTAHPSDEARSAFSPSGDLLAFESERDGPRNIYVMPVTVPGGGRSLVGGAVRRVTASDRAQALSGFSADGTSVLFSSNHEPSIHRAARMYRAAVDAPEAGGSAMERVTDAFGSGAREAADGGVLFYRGRYDATRPRYTGSANPDVWRLDAKGAFTRLTTSPHNDADAFPLPDGSVVFVSSRDGQNNVWRLKPGAADRAAEQLTRFAPAAGEATIGHGVRDLNVPPGGWTAVFCVWDTMYTLDCRSMGAAPEAVPLAAGGDFALLDFQRTNVSRQVTDAALSPDGKTVALIARGEVFTRSTEKDRPTRRVTGSGNAGHSRARDLAWSPDGRVLYFSSDMSGVSGVYAATVAMSREDLGEGEKPERPAEKAEEEKPKADPAEPAGDEKPGDAAAGDKADADKGAEAPTPRRSREKKPDHGKRWADAITFTVEPVAVSKAEQRRPVPSPDGKHLLITRGLGDLVMIEVADAMPRKGADERLVLSSWNDPTVQWAADSRHIVYEAMDVNYNADIWIADALAAAGSDAAKPVNLTRHPDSDHSARLSADGKVLYFLSDRDAAINGQDDLFAVNLDRRLDGLRPYELADYFKEAGDKAKRRRPLGAPASAPRR